MTPRHRERLWPSPSGWLLVPAVGLVAFVVLLPIHQVAAWVGAAAALVGAAMAAVALSPVVLVVDGELRAGRAHIPVQLLTGEQVLDRAGLRAVLGPGSDARTFMCLRAWIPTAIRAEVCDPQDPTPAWVVSSRNPQALLAALRAERQAHSRHTS